MINGKTQSMARVIAGVLMVVSVSGCGLNGPAHKAPAPNVTAVVDLGFMSYDPVNVTIHPGDTVEWRNTSIITHTVTNDPERAKKREDASLPAGAQAFDSGDIPAGQVYTHIFTTPGTYHYFCTHHENHGMVGTVVVMPAL
jgi:plastocyanin